LATAIDLCTLAWSDQQGYVSLAVRDSTKDKKEPGYWKDLIFKWPEDRPRIEATLKKAKTSAKDVYWAPAVFDRPQRSADAVMPLTTLYADLDEVDPHDLPSSLKPTAAWESSPGRYQAIWQLDTALRPGAQQELNKMLTYAIGADKGGWDLTQVLRTPGTPNHKYEAQPRVKLLWLNGHRLNPATVIDDLPSIPQPEHERLPDPLLTLRRLNNRLNAHAKGLIKARYAKVGQRSERLWELECLLAEAGAKPEQIAAVAQATVWNKFKGRHDEVQRLLTEAAKAIEHAGVDVAVDDALEEEGIFEEDEVEQVAPQSWVAFDKEHTAIRWLVADIWGEGEVGFISGLPKSYKSWLALDLAVSIATGSRFLGSFQSRCHPVLLIQEEDPKPVLQDRLTKVAAAKGLIQVETDNSDQSVKMMYELPDNLHIISNQGFTLDEEWLELLEAWIEQFQVKVVVLDPLMMIAGGDFDEFKAFDFMQKILKPLKRVRSRTGAAIVLVHHHIKGSAAGTARDMYGSVALWAWEEAALHLQVSGVGKVTAERFSKHALLPPFVVEIGELSEAWSPIVGTGATSALSLFDILATMESGATAIELAKYVGISQESCRNQLNALLKEDKIFLLEKRHQGRGRPQSVWKVKR